MVTHQLHPAALALRPVRPFHGETDGAEKSTSESSLTDDPSSSDPPTSDLEEIYRRYSPYVAKIGHRLLGRDSEIDDLVQDVFVVAHRGLRKLRKQEAVKGWLATVTVRLARRRLRTRRLRATFHLDSMPDYVDVAGPTASPDQKAQVAQIYRLLDRMPVNQRIAWSLRYVEGETLERIAELCDCSLATAKRRIKAAQDVIKMEVSSA